MSPNITKYELAIDKLDKSELVTPEYWLNRPDMMGALTEQSLKILLYFANKDIGERTLMPPGCLIVKQLNVGSQAFYRALRILKESGLIMVVPVDRRQSVYKLAPFLYEESYKNKIQDILKLKEQYREELNK